MNESHEQENNEDAAPPSIPKELNDPTDVFIVAAAFIESWGGASSNSEPPEVSQRGAVEEWASRFKGLIPPSFFDGLEIVSESTSEHKVFYRATDNRAIKRTWAGVYGQIPIPRDGKLDRRNASPSEYLRRMALQMDVFESDFRLEGVFRSDEPSMVLFQLPGQPSFVISQTWFEKAVAPSVKEISEFLREESFAPVPDSYFGWVRVLDGVVIVDAKPDNFIKTNLGLVPIDLQMQQFDTSKLRQAGLWPDKDPRAQG